MIAGVFSAIIFSIAGQRNPELFRNSPGIIFALCCLPLTAGLSVLSLIINAAVTQFIARLLGGTGTYSQLVYAFAAYTAPITIVSSILGVLGAALPVLGFIFSPLLGIYSLVLNVMAVKAVNQFSWGKAILTSVIIFVLVLIIVSVIVGVVIAILAASGGAINDIFQNIIRNMPAS